MDMSLDEIIKKNKSKVVKKKPLNAFIQKKLSSPQKIKTDVRSKIISKARTKISDAREKIVQVRQRSIVDARLMLKNKTKAKINKKNVNKIHKKRPMIYDSDSDSIDLTMLDIQRSIQSANGSARRSYDEYDEVSEPRFVSRYKVQPGDLKRTVKNDMMPSYTSKQSSSSMEIDDSDPFDCYVVPTRRPVLPETSKRRVDNYYPPRQMSAHMDAAEYMPRGILRSSNKEPERFIERSPEFNRYDDYEYERSRSRERRRESDFDREPYLDRYVDNDKSFTPHISDNMRSRLTDKARDPNESMGIFAKMPLQNMEAQKHKQQHHQQPHEPSGHRIIVSNLHSSVTDGDVRELFEDIGPLVSSKLVRTGVAEVVYKSLKNAEEAVDTYHNRQLDGQPMKCLLCKNRAYGKPTAPAISSSSSYSRTSNSYRSDNEVDVETLHKVLFRR